MTLTPDIVAESQRTARMIKAALKAHLDGKTVTIIVPTEGYGSFMQGKLREAIRTDPALSSARWTAIHLYSLGETERFDWVRKVPLGMDVNQCRTFVDPFIASLRFIPTGNFKAHPNGSHHPLIFKWLKEEAEREPR